MKKLLLLFVLLSVPSFAVTAATLKGSYSARLTQSYNYWQNQTATEWSEAPSVGVLVVATFNGINTLTGTATQLYTNGMTGASPTNTLQTATFSGTYVVGPVGQQPGFVTITITAGAFKGSVFTGVISASGTRLELLQVKGAGSFGVLSGTAIRQ
jgi:hypothetical protein